MGRLESLDSRLEAGEVVIMDGGTGTEIQRRGVPVSNETWSGTPMLTHPDAIRRIHEDYIRAGAEIIITNTFSVRRDILAREGLADRTSEINKIGVKKALEARGKAAKDKPLWIAGSMSTYSLWMEPAVTPSFQSALTDYREQAEALAEGGVDLILIEMLIRTLDASAAVEAAAETGLPVWVGFSLQREGDNLFLGLHGKHANETIPAAVEAVSSERVSAMFIMHSLPKDTGPGLQILRQCTSLPIGAYAHSMDFPTAEQRPDSILVNPLTPSSYLRYAQDWVRLGAQIIGGCCGITPEHIQVLGDKLKFDEENLD